MNLELLGKRLRAARKGKGMTLTDLEKLTGKTNGYLSLLERGKKTPSLDFLKELSNIYNISISYFLGETNIKSNSTDEITQAIEDNPELLEFWNEMEKREELRLMFKQTRNLPKEAIEDVLRIIKRIEVEEGNYKS